MDAERLQRRRLLITHPTEGKGLEHRHSRLGCQREIPVAVTAHDSLGDLGHVFARVAVLWDLRRPAQKLTVAGEQRLSENLHLL